MSVTPALVGPRVRLSSACVCLVLLSSCAIAPIWFSDDSIRPSRPADALLNKGAGRGDNLFVTLRLETGEELLFLVDTGSPCREHQSSISPEVLQDALALVTARVDIKWTDWSGEAVLRQIKEPVLLIGGGKDTICTTNDLKVLEQAAPAGSKSLLIAEANRWAVRYWFHEISEPVKTWFQEHLPTRSDVQSVDHKATSQSRPKSSP